METDESSRKEEKNEQRRIGVTEKENSLKWVQPLLSQ